jgi:hypothetical protein
VVETSAEERDGEIVLNVLSNYNATQRRGTVNVYAENN